MSVAFLLQIDSRSLETLNPLYLKLMTYLYEPLFSVQGIRHGASRADYNSMCVQQEQKMIDDDACEIRVICYCSYLPRAGITDKGVPTYNHQCKTRVYVVRIVYLSADIPHYCATCLFYNERRLVWLRFDRGLQAQSAYSI